MKPFVSKVKDFVSQDGKFSPGPLEFLNDWESPINDKNLEKLTPLGAKDSTEVRSIQPSKIPPPSSPRSDFFSFSFITNLFLLDGRKDEKTLSSTPPSQWTWKIKER